MTPNAEIEILEEVIDEVECFTSVEDVVEYLSGRITYAKDQHELEKTIYNLSNEDIVEAEETV